MHPFQTDTALGDWKDENPVCAPQYRVHQQADLSLPLLTSPSVLCLNICLASTFYFGHRWFQLLLKKTTISLTEHWTFEDNFTLQRC